MLEDNDIVKLLNAFENSLDYKLDKKFQEQSELFELKLENKGKIWAERTVKEVLKSIGLDVDAFKEIQSDLAFLHWLRLLCTNMVSKTIMIVGGIWGVSAAVEYLRSRGYIVK